MKILEFVILCSNCWLKIELTARHKNVFLRCRLLLVFSKVMCCTGPGCRIASSPWTISWPAAAAALSLSACRFRWVLRLPLWLNFLPQMSQTCGFSPVCVSLCFRRLECSVKERPQNMHWYGLSPGGYDEKRGEKRWKVSTKEIREERKRERKKEIKEGRKKEGNKETSKEWKEERKVERN